MSGLRARQRLQTTEMIRCCAVDLVYEHGLDNVTTEMISDAAGISPRTFFNYFPYKEAALNPPIEEFPDEAVARFIAAEGTILDDLAELVIPMTAKWDKNRPMLKKLFEIADSHPKTLMLKASSIQEHEMGLRMLLALRLGEDENAYAPVLIAAVVTSALRVAMETWAGGAVGSPEDSVRRALSNIMPLIGQ